MRRIYQFLFVAIALLAGQNLTASSTSDSLKVSFYYEVAKHDIDHNFVRHQKMVREMADTCHVDSVRIYGWVSPEGGVEFNRRLAQDRADELARLVSMQWPWAVVLDVKGRGVDYAIEQKRENWPLMRRADAYVWYHPIPKDRAPKPVGCQCNPCMCNPCVCGTGVACGCEDREPIRDTVVLYYTPEPKKERVLADQTPAWALKTNLLLLGVAAPNVQAEFPLGSRNRWSVEGEFIFPWWTFSHNAYAEQILNWGVEFRYWLGRREYHPVLDGWHIGLAAAFGYYDLEWKSEGFQGEHVNGYLNFGYQHRWGSRNQCGIDAGIGIGALYTPLHRHYLGSTLFPENHTEQYDDHLMYRNKGTLLWPGASHVNVTLMYFFDMKRKEDKR